MALTDKTIVSMDLFAEAKVADPPIKKMKPRTVKPRKPRDLASMFWKKLKGITVDKLKEGKPWLAEKNFRLVSTDKDLGEWVDQVLADKSRWLAPYSKKPDGVRMPVVAVDTENWGLDTRILHHMEKGFDAAGNTVWKPIYEVKIELAGVCLSVDGITGIYVPVNHVDGNNCTREGTRYHLQRLFDVSHLVFYNAKYDREVLRLTLDLNLRDYPFYEDVQGLKYINDPKAKLNEGDKTSYAGDAIGLKGLSWKELGYRQIELDELGKVKADWRDPKTGEISQRNQYVPFMWIPTELALWYAAGDAICTWLLWDKFRDLAQSRTLPHIIDGELVDTITWMERQRFLIDAEPHGRMVRWHEHKMAQQRQQLRELAIRDGWKEEYGEDGELLENTKFSVDSGKMLPDLLYRIKGLKVVKYTDAQNPKPSTDKNALAELIKLYPEDKFLKALKKYKEYVSLHPENLAYDPYDNTARIYLKQSTVAGGRLAASGGNFNRDGGFSLNPQAIKKIGKRWYVRGNVLVPDRVAEEDIEPHEESELHPSCFMESEEDVVVGYREEVRLDPVTGEPVLERSEEEFEDEEGNSLLDDDDFHEEGKPIIDRIPITEKRKVRKKASGIIKNHIANFVGYSICLVPGCTTCEEKHGILMRDSKLDANEILNFRCLFIADKGWTFLSSDYSNVEMRIAANLSLEPKFVHEFLQGSGDFHTLTAIACFSEFNDPKTSKDQRKFLRGLAKIINFALLYGGTAFTIFQNMKSAKPDITWKQAEDMVKAYWDSVPLFKIFCDGKQAIARDQFLCTTDMGRVVNFQSALESEGLRVPTKPEMDNNWEYIRLRKRHKAALEEKDEEQAKHLKEHMDRLWKDPETGVRNAQYFNKFLGKIQRVSVNVPFQGLAGDLMRISMNRVRKWALNREPGVQAVLRMHCSVHDELDYAVKNEYLPFVVPRISRAMKLRRLHASRKWPIQLEIDTEYAHSWDVDAHLTGDADHMPAGWTDAEGMERYLPQEFSPETFEQLYMGVSSDRPELVAKTKEWLKANLHPRTENAQLAVFEDLKKKPMSAKGMRKQLYAALQLHEYWTVDEVPDDCDQELETLEEFEARCGLTTANRGFAPAIGYLGSVPFEQARRPKIPELGPEPEPEPEPEPKKLTKKEVMAQDQMGLFGAADTATEASSSCATAVLEAPEVAEDEDEIHVAWFGSSEFEEATSFSPEEFTTTAPASEEDEMFMPTPRRKQAPSSGLAPLPVAKTPAINPRGLPWLRDGMTQNDFKRFVKAMGFGSAATEVFYMGRELTVYGDGDKPVPEEFLRA